MALYYQISLPDLIQIVSHLCHDYGQQLSDQAVFIEPSWFQTCNLNQLGWDSVIYIRIAMYNI